MRLCWFAPRTFPACNPRPPARLSLRLELYLYLWGIRGARGGVVRVLCCGGGGKRRKAPLLARPKPNLDPSLPQPPPPPFEPKKSVAGGFQATEHDEAPCSCTHMALSALCMYRDVHTGR